MSTYTVHAAKTNLSKLIERAEKGEEVVIARGKTPVARHRRQPCGTLGPGGTGSARRR